MVRGGEPPLEVASLALPGELMGRVARSRKPCLAIMNMPPLPYLKRIPGLSTQALEGCYADPAVWEDFDPRLMTLASLDPQAFRPQDQPKNVLQVGLATNFKAARFESDECTAPLRDLEAGIEAARFPLGYEEIAIPVKLKVHDSVFVPLAKWPMLIAGNYRCIRPGGMIPIREAVHGDVDASRRIYDWVANLCTRLGASHDDLVPFDKYAKAAEGLGKPSSAAWAARCGARRRAPGERSVSATLSSAAPGSGRLRKLQASPERRSRARSASISSSMSATSAASSGAAS